MASAAQQGREALAKFLQTTHDKLNAEGFAPDADMLKKIMPSVAEGIRGLSAGAPADVRTKFKAALEEAKVLPSFEGDLDGLRTAIATCIEVLGSAGSGPAAATDAGYVKAAEAPQAKAADVPEEEEAGDMDDPFAMLGGMGEEEVYKITLVDERKDEPAEAKTEAAPAVNGAAQGKEALVTYLQDTIKKLAGPAPDAAMLKETIMPSVVNSVMRLSGSAPQEVRDKFKDSFMSNKVIPAFEADIDGFRTALEQCLEVMTA